MKKYTYEAPEILLELVDEDIITFSYADSESEIFGEEIPME